MACLLTYLLVLAAGPVDLEMADRVLLDRARDAQRSGDSAAVQRFMRGWASLRSRENLPKGLESEAARALAFTEENGRLRLYGSWRDGRIRVGVRDAAEVVDRVYAWSIDSKGRRTQLVQVGQEPDGGLLYRVDEEAVTTVVIEAVMLSEETIVVAATTLRRVQAELPSPPDPEALPRRLVEKPVPVPPRSEPSSPVTWWWIVAGAAAAAVTGWAIAEEVR